MKTQYWRYFLFLLWICYLIAASILLFTRGFLLRRDVFTDKSDCNPYHKIPCTSVNPNLNGINGTKELEYQCSQQDTLLQLLGDINSASRICFPQKARIILIVVDALRYDFVVYNPELENPTPFQNKLPIIDELLTRENYTRLYKFIADPPTTTMQRLKALTTGGLPTFIDAGSNFATPEINEDNIVDQLIHHKQNVVFMGDDTWSNLYPNRFLRSWPYPSFNVWDLDTVDNGVKEHLFTEIKRSDWDLLIGHFLGVDHCGHRYGPYHNEMRRKLSEINIVIREIVNTMDNNTMLFVIGDHGMTSTGDHGGNSELEVTATLFIYSLKPLVSFDYDLKTNFVKQVDLIPTLASILGVPIPYSNLGSVILNAFPEVDNTKNWQLALLALWSNVQQVTTFINRYSSISNQFNAEKMELINMKFATLNVQVQSINSEYLFRAFVRDAKKYLVLVREVCEEVWVQFDSFSMSRGLLLSFLTVFFVYMLSDGLPTQQQSKIFRSSFVFCSYILLAIVGIGCFVCYQLSLVENFELSLYFATGVASIFMLALLIVQNWETIAIHWYECTKIRQWFDVMCRLILVLFVCIDFSNSYIIEEAHVLSYLLLAIVGFLIYDTLNRAYEKYASVGLKTKWRSLRLKLVIMGLCFGVFLRLSQQFWKCREEQNWCINHTSRFEELLKLGTDPGKVQWLFTLFSLALFVTVTRIWLRSCGNLVGFSAQVTLARYAPSVIVVCTMGFWVLHRLPSEAKNKLVALWQVDILAWTVYLLVITCLIFLLINPLYLYGIRPKNETLSVYGRDNIVPQLFNHIKNLYNSNSNNDNSNMPVVYGLTTVYSAAFVVISVLVTLLFAILLGDEYAPASVVMYFSAVILLAVISIAQYEKASKLSQLFEVPSSSIFCWVLLSNYFFYGTAHQPSFPTIHWEAAFVGTGGHFTSTFLPAILIGINTFGVYILMGVTLPLLLIGPFTFYVMFPTMTSKRFADKDLKKGELLLYENDQLFMQGAFNVCCKYVLFHGIRMFACMLAVTIHCRHLMVWSIFAPKLIFEALSLMVTLGSVIFGYLLLMRINTSVKTLISNIEKQSR